jgi:FecR protein
MNTAKNIIIILSICLAACLMLVSEASYAGDAGHAQFVIGRVQITSAAGQTSVLKKGDAVKEGDTLTTADAASAQIKMLDGGLIAVRPDTKLKFDTFKFNGTQDGSERSFFSLFTGGFRAVTGLIGQLHKPNFRITTTAATIGIRGTDHETYVVTADSPMAAVVPIGTYNKVNRGETTMTTTKGTISVLPNQMGFVGAADQMPTLQPLNTRIFTVSDRPLTEAKGDKKEGKEVKETASVDKTGKKETAVEVASSAKSNDGKEVRVAATEADAVTAVNWGDQDGSIKNTNQVAGKEKIAAPTPTVSGTNTYTNIVGPGTASTNNPNSVGANQNAAPTPTVSGTNTYTNIVGPGTASTNNLNSVGANQNGQLHRH